MVNWCSYKDEEEDAAPLTRQAKPILQKALPPDKIVVN
jgi:hypothetical protein